jgi:hypothetical protein
MLQPSARYQGEEAHLEMVGVDGDDDFQSKRRNSGDRLLGPESGSPRGGSRPGSAASTPRKGGGKSGESETRVLADCSASLDEEDPGYGKAHTRG